MCSRAVVHHHSLSLHHRPKLFRKSDRRRRRDPSSENSLKAGFNSSTRFRSRRRPRLLCRPSRGYGLSVFGIVCVCCGPRSLCWPNLSFSGCLSLFAILGMCRNSPSFRFRGLCCVLGFWRKPSLSTASCYLCRIRLPGRPSCCCRVSLGNCPSSSSRISRGLWARRLACSRWRDCCGVTLLLHYAASSTTSHSRTFLLGGRLRTLGTLQNVESQVL